MIPLFLTIVSLHCVASQEATLYDYAGYGGNSVTVPIGECKNVLEFNDRTSSVRTNACIRLWEHSDCTGRSLDVKSPGDDNLADDDFNDLLTSVSSCEGGVRVHEEIKIEFDFSKDSDSRVVEYARKIKPVIEAWFPQLQNIVTTGFYRPVKKVKINFDPNSEHGVAAAYWWEPRIEVNSNWLKNNLEDAVGMMIHEMTHVVQQPRSHKCPRWVVEGFAEYTRRWHFEPKSTAVKPKASEWRNRINPYFGDWLLAYLESVFGPRGKPFMYILNRKCQEGNWYGRFLKDITGKDEMEWWNQMLDDDEFPWKRLR